MLIRKLNGCAEILAGDHTRLRELLHPGREYDFDARFSLAHTQLEAGAESRVHRLISTEVYYILSGSGEMHIDAESAAVGPGDAVVIPAEAEQWIRNTGDGPLQFLCIVDPAWRVEDEDILG